MITQMSSERRIQRNIYKVEIVIEDNGLGELVVKSEEVTLLDGTDANAGGLITFTKIDFETAEDQYFLVKEKNGGETIDGITYDDNEYRVWVEVTDDLKGQLHATVHIYDKEGIPQDTMLFVNVYEIIGGAALTLFARDKKRKAVRDM